MELIQDLEGIKKKDLHAFISKELNRFPDAKKVLILFPDYTRFDFTREIVPLIVKRYSGAILHFLNAGGTHRPMTDDEIEHKLGIDKSISGVRFFNHNFSDPDSLITVGTISKELVREKTNGQLNEDIDITVNKLILADYDLIIALSATVPHEAAGYSGGLKIFFPGISGPNVIDLFHWAAVLVGISNIIGTADNNARDIINQGAKTIFDEICAHIYSFNMVNIEEDGGIMPIGLYIDSGYDGFLSTYRKASGTASKLHVKYIDEPLASVVQVIPKNYDEIWLAGKGSYKLQRPGVLCKGAEVIIYAPHIKCFHTNPDIERDLFSLGYHCRENVCSLIENRVGLSRNAAAHLINVCGPGVFDPRTGKEDLHFKVILATSIPEGECRKIGLDYRDPATIKRSNFEGLGKLWIEEGGKYLYDLRKKDEL